MIKQAAVTAEDTLRADYGLVWADQAPDAEQCVAVMVNGEFEARVFAVPGGYPFYTFRNGRGHRTRNPHDTVEACKLAAAHCMLTALEEDAARALRALTR